MTTGDRSSRVGTTIQRTWLIPAGSRVSDRRVPKPWAPAILIVGRHLGLALPHGGYALGRPVNKQRKAHPVKGLSRYGTPAVHVVRMFLLFAIVGCGNNPTPGIGSKPAVSSIYTDFHPEDEFRRQGFQVDAAAGGGRTSAAEKYGWRP